MNQKTQLPPAKIKIESIQKLKFGDLDDLCDATESAITEGGGFGWIEVPSRKVLENYWRGVLTIPERELIIGRLDNVEPSPLNDVADITPLVASKVIPVPTFIVPKVPTPLIIELSAVIIPTTCAFPLTSKDFSGTVVPIPTRSPFTTRTESSTCTPSLKLNVFLILGIYQYIFSYLFRFFVTKETRNGISPKSIIVI